jgi:hypothetical protein
MRDAAESGYRFLKRGIALGVVMSALVGATVTGAFAAGTFDGGEKVGKALDYGDYSLAASTYAINVDDTLYQYATGKDGNAYYTYKNGQEWSKWEGWDNQPVKFSGDPAPIAYRNQNYAFYHGEDDHIYHLIWKADGTSYFEDVSGDYTYQSAPYANVYDGELFLYATGTDGDIWERWYSPEEGWHDWATISSGNASSYKPYAVDWGGKENAFWTADDGKVYWSRYDGSSWNEAKALPGDYEFAYTPYAAGYDDKLFAHAVTQDGKAAYNVFDGESWSGWETEGAGYKVKAQPSAYVYEDLLHVVYAGEDGHAYYTAYDGASWTDWADLGGNYDYSPYQYAYQDNLYLTYTGEDGYAWSKTYAAGDDDQQDTYE